MKAFHLAVCLLMEETDLRQRSSEQLRRASYSVVLNIAEGSGRFSKADRRNFYMIARGSVFERVAIYDILRDQNIIDENRFTELLQSADELSRMLFAMIKNLNS